MLDKNSKSELDKAMSSRVYAWMSERYVADVVTLGLSTSTNSVKPDLSANRVKQLKLQLFKMGSFAASLGMAYLRVISSLRFTKTELR